MQGFCPQIQTVHKSRNLLVEKSDWVSNCKNQVCKHWGQQSPLSACLIAHCLQWTLPIKNEHNLRNDYCSDLVHAKIVDYWVLKAVKSIWAILNKIKYDSRQLEGLLSSLDKLKFFY